MTKTTVAVMMPFGGSFRSEMTDKQKKAVRVQQRRCRLEFLRLKYLIEQKCSVNPRESRDGEELDYEVKLFQAETGEIARGALTLIRDADVLIGLLTEKNVNVIYELAIRNALRDIPIMIVKGNPNELKPIYLRDSGHIVYSEGLDGRVKKEIDRIALDELPEVIEEIPESLRLTIDKYDELLEKKLENVLQAKEEEIPPRRPVPVEELFPGPPEQKPTDLLVGWDNEYFPFTLVKIPWQGKDDPLRPYTLDDLNGGPDAIQVCEWNEAFLRLFALKEDAARSTKLNDGMLLDRLEKFGYLSPEDRVDFDKDQAEAGQTIVFNEDYGKATVPLRLGHRHSDSNFRNRSLLPCVIGRRVIGEKTHDHTTYLIVSYVDVTESEAREERPVESNVTAATPK